MHIDDAKPPFSVFAVADRAWNIVAETTLRTSWSPIARLAETAVISLIQKIKVGQLRILTYSHTYTFPIQEHSNKSKPANKNPGLTAELRVINDSFWVRLCAMGDLGFAEAYMYGDVECDDLVSLFEIFLANRENLSNLDSRLSYLFTLPQKITSYRFLNTIGNSRSNISAHYDISNEMFAGFLSEDMTYSCAIFPELDGDLRGEKDVQCRWNGGQSLKRISLDAQLPPSPPNSIPGGETPQQNISPLPEFDPLYEAQLRKLDHIISKLHIPMPTAKSETLHVLEIGTGWGALAIRLAEQFSHVQIDTITLSSAQKILAEERIAARGLSERIKVHLMDYRKMPSEWAGRFSRFVSVEMIEAVGREFLTEYWRVVDWAMEEKGAVGVVQVITIPEARFERYIKEIDFIRKWSESTRVPLLLKPNLRNFAVFPGGFLPTLTYLMTTLADGSKGKLVTESVSNIGPHYARTLREWRQRFVQRFEAVIAPALQREYASRCASGKGGQTQTLGREEIEVFKRKWLCESSESPLPDFARHHTVHLRRGHFQRAVH